MATFPASNKVPGVSTGLTSDLDSVYGLLQKTLGPYVVPSGDTTGATDPVNVQAALSAYGIAVLTAGAYYGNATVTGNEGQFLLPLGGFQGTTWNLKTTGIPAFQWKQANPAVYVSTGAPGGGILEPGLTIVGPGGPSGTNPSDGSIAFQGADIAKVRCKIQAVNCQWGLLSSNQNFFTEQGTFEVHSQSCTNPAVFQVATTGGAGRTGSFARTEVTVYHNDFLNGSFGGGVRDGVTSQPGGVQLLNGAQFDSLGKIKQYGNFNTSGGAGQAGVYALYVSGSFGGNPSCLIGTNLMHGLESGATSNKPGTIFVASGCLINPAWGALAYGNGMGVANITTTGIAWSFAGPISGDSSLISALWKLATTGFATGWSGNIWYRFGPNQDNVELLVEINVTSGTAITQNQVIWTLPSSVYFPSTNKNGSFTFGAGGVPSQQPFTINTSGQLQWAGAATTPGANGFWSGTITYPMFI